MSKKARSEGNKVASLIKANKAEFYIADVDLEDDSEDVVAAVTNAVKTLGKFKSAFMVISAGTKVLTVVVTSTLDSGSENNNTSGDHSKNNINIEDWLTNSIKDIQGDRTLVGGDNYLSMVITADTPFKLKDQVRSSGFRYLSSKGYLGEEESSEEFVGFD